MSKSVLKEIVEDLTSIRHEFRLKPDITDYINKQATKYNNKTTYFDNIIRDLMNKGYHITEPWTTKKINNINAEWENRKENGR